MRRDYSSLKNAGIFGVLALMVLIGFLVNRRFFAPSNLVNISKVVSIVLVISLGQLIVILSGGIDLSIGSVLAFSGVVSALVVKAVPSMALAVLAAVLCGVVIGLFNAFCITNWSAPPFIVTLAMMQIARSGALIVTGGSPVEKLGDKFRFIGNASVLGVPVLLIIALILFALTLLLMQKTTVGRYIYSIGGNELAAQATGVRVNAIKYFVYVFSAVLASLAGVMLMARASVGHPLFGEGYEFNSIIAVIVGGTSFTGGRGTVSGTIAGALIIVLINNILNLVGVGSFVQIAVKGVIILIAVTINYQTRRLEST